MVKIRFNRRRKNVFQIVAIDERRPRDSGKILEYLGYYSPLNKDTNILNYVNRIKRWIFLGAKPTKTVYNSLKKNNISL